MTEIERKYLVNGKPWEGISGNKIKQGYIPKGDTTVRIRTSDDKAYLTIKGKTVGLSRHEFEYEIDFDDACKILSLFCGKIIKKTRYIIPHKKFSCYFSDWEVDVFEGENKGLVVAEIELESEDQHFEVPEWIGEEVSHDPRYRNSALLDCPWPFEIVKATYHNNSDG